MILSIIGAGFGRTGTLSLNLALGQLGFGPCHHMNGAFAQAGHAQPWIGRRRISGTRWPGSTIRRQR